MSLAVSCLDRAALHYDPIEANITWILWSLCVFLQFTGFKKWSMLISKKSYMLISMYDWKVGQYRYKDKDLKRTTKATQDLCKAKT